MAQKKTGAEMAQELLRKAVERRDELNVFIGVLQAMIAEQAQCQRSAGGRRD